MRRWRFTEASALVWHIHGVVTLREALPPKWSWFFFFGMAAYELLPTLLNMRPFAYDVTCCVSML